MHVFSKEEVWNILIAEYDYDTDIAVQREESLMLGIQQGKTLGLTEGAHQKALETAKNLLHFGLSVENIAKATGLNKEDVETLI